MRDVVAGRSSYQIESAKKKAVKGGGRKRCRKGKSCGSTCISSYKVCMVDLPWVFSKEFSMTIEKIQSYRKTERLSPVSPLEGVKKAGREFMSPYDERLASISSIYNRVQVLSKSLKDKIKSGELSVKEKLRYKRVLFRLSGYENKARDKQNAIMKEIRNKLLDTKLSDQEVDKMIGKIKFDSSRVSSNTTTEKQVKRQVEEFVRMFNGKGFIEKDENGTPIWNLKEVQIDPKERAYASGGFIRVPPYKETVFHEIGHILEDGRQWLASYAADWRDSKAFTLSQVNGSRELDRFVRNSDGNLIPSSTRRDASGVSKLVFRLAEMPPYKNGIFDLNEIVVVDKFISPYMGKVYSNVGITHTEVISMAIQHFASAPEMRMLYNSHPDLFEVIVGLART